MDLNNTTLEVQMAFVQRNGYAIKYIDNPSIEVQLAAVQENGYTIRHIENPSLDVQMTAIEWYYNVCHTKGEGRPPNLLEHIMINQSR